MRYRLQTITSCDLSTVYSCPMIKGGMNIKRGVKFSPLLFMCHVMRYCSKLFLRLGLMLILLSGCMDEEKKIYYATFDEAVENAAIPKGQLPPIIP